jgi:hypothetical protein
MRSSVLISCPCQGASPYGLIQGKTSFREMERLAASDLGALWICGGLMPDHTAIFRFINRHSDLIEGDFFEQLTMKIVQANRIDVNDVNDVNDIAIDGTVTQAVGSRYKKLRLEKIDEKEDESEKTERQHESDDKVIPSLKIFRLTKFLHFLKRIHPQLTS